MWTAVVRSHSAGNLGRKRRRKLTSIGGVEGNLEVGKFSWIEYSVLEPGTDMHETLHTQRSVGLGTRGRVGKVTRDLILFYD